MKEAIKFTFDFAGNEDMKPFFNKLDKNIEDITFTEVKPTNKEK